MVEAEEAPIINNCDEGVAITPVAADASAAAEVGPGGGDADDGPVPSAGDAIQSVPPHVSLVPPEGCIAITQDGGVLKKVLEAGDSDDKPSLHARCLIHYVGYLASSGEVFMNTRLDRETEAPAVVVAGRTAAAQETGLCLAAASMSKGEKALVYIQQPSYGYGAMGSFSFPCVPPNSQLVYDVEMVNWEGIDETDNDRDRGTLLFEERLERAERRREAGNQMYKEGKYKEALAKYAMALSYMDEDFMYQLEGHYLDKAEAVKLRVHLNMAAAQLNTRDFNTAIYNCGQVLTIDPANVKAMFRRGKASHALGRTEEAMKDLEAALKIDPKDKAIISEMHAVKATIKKEKAAVRGMFEGRFNTNNNPAPAAEAAAAATHATAPPPSSSSAAADRGGAAASSSVEAGGGGSGGASKRSSSTSPPKTGSGGGGKSVAAKGKVAMAGRSRQPGAAGVLAGLLAGLAWLWSVIVAALAGLGARKSSVAKRRPPVTQRARGT